LLNKNGAMIADKNDMLTAGKIAKELGVSPAKLKKIIKELEIEPDLKKGNCSYYGPKTVAKIKKNI
jgi:predicted transcriptional regulator